MGGLEVEAGSGGGRSVLCVCAHYEYMISMM